MTTLTNIEIVQAFSERDLIATELAELTAKMQELYKAQALLATRNEAATKTTEIHNGVALAVCDSHVFAVDYQIGRWASVYEHVRNPGTFLVRANIRGAGDSLLPEVHTSRKDAMRAAKDFVAQ